MQKLRWGLFLIGCVGSFACAGRRYFSPAESAHTRTVRGYDVAYFELTGSSGPFGEVMLSSGAYEERDLGVIELKLALRNTGSEELSVAASDLMLDALRTSEALPGALTAAETGTFRVAPGSDRRLLVHFVLPPGVSHYDVTGFTLQWRIRSGAGTFERRTAFRQEHRSLQVPGGIPQVTMPGP